jgi:hypothetical protein
MKKSFPGERILSDLTTRTKRIKKKFLFKVGWKRERGLMATRTKRIKKKFLLPLPTLHPQGGVEKGKGVDGH